MTNQIIHYLLWDSKNNKELHSFDSSVSIHCEKGNVFVFDTDLVSPMVQKNLFVSYKNDFAQHIVDSWEYKHKQDGEYKVVRIGHYFKQGFNIKMEEADTLNRYQCYEKITIQIDCVPYTSINNRLKYLYWGVKRKLRVVFKH